jgi:hypothetical protein
MKKKNVANKQHKSNGNRRLVTIGSRIYFSLSGY